jgi:putative salt-induced outer membrane protein YdiY
MLPLTLLLSALPALPTESQPLEAQATPAPEVAKPKWTGSVSLGATYSDGNTDRRSTSATADAEYRREKDRTTLGLLWNYAEEQGSVTDRKAQGRIKYDRFFSKKMYGLAQTSAEYDWSASLDLRYTAGLGVGYQFQDKPSWKVSGELGVSYVNNDYVGTVDDTDYVAARAAYNWDWKPNTKYNLSQTGEIFPSLETADDVSARVDTKGRMNLTDKMFAQLQWLFQWDNTPATGKVRTDNLVMLGIGWSF